MTEQIFTPGMAALLRSGRMPVGMPPPPPVEDPNGLTLAALARAGLLGSGPAVSPMPPTLMEEARAPQQAPMPQPPGGIDYSNAGMSGARPLAEATPAGAGPLSEGERGYYRNPQRPTTGVAARPQSSAESFDLAQQGRDLAFVGGTAANVAVGGPVARGADLAMRGAGAVGRAVAASPAGQWVGRQVGRIAEHPTLAGYLAAGGTTLATPGQTQQSSPIEAAQKATHTAQREFDALTKERERVTTRQTELEQQAQQFANLNRSDRAAVQRVQEALQLRGLYLRNSRGQPVQPDGIWGDGMALAMETFQRQIKQDRDKVDRDLQALGTRVDAANTTLQSAQTTERDAAGAARMREIGQPGFIENYGPLLGYPAGLAAGMWGRGKLASYIAKGAETRANRANALATEFGQGTVPERAGRLNQYWTEGGGSPAPFRFAPDRQPYPWQSVTREVQARPGGVATRDVPTADQLYRPGLNAQVGPFAATTGTGAAEMATGAYFSPGAHRELEAAQSAVSAPGGMTEANIQRLIQARRAVAWWDGVTNFGRGTIGGAVVGEAKGRVKGIDYMRPSVGLAEAERGNVDLLLRGALANPAPALPPPASGPTMLPHSSVYQPRAGGRFSAGRPVYPPGDPRRGR